MRKQPFCSQDMWNGSRHRLPHRHGAREIQYLRARVRVLPRAARRRVAGREKLRPRRAHRGGAAAAALGDGQVEGLGHAGRGRRVLRRLDREVDGRVGHEGPGGVEGVHGAVEAYDDIVLL